MVGAGRDNDVDSGGGTELSAVIGHAPRHLDRNVTLLGKVVQGIELLSPLPRGTGAMGFTRSRNNGVMIKSFKLASEVPEGAADCARGAPHGHADIHGLHRCAAENRHEEWFKVPRPGTC